MVWAAQRIGDDHIGVVANAFVLRGIDPDDDNFLYSDNIWSEGEKTGRYSAGEVLDFAAVFGSNTGTSAYSTRRQWRVLSIAAPSQDLPSEVDWLGDGLPTSVKVDKPLSVRDVFAMKRDLYEGTAYDLTQPNRQLPSSPFGDPSRYDASPETDVNGNGLTQAEIDEGGFERAISMFRTSYSVVSQTRPGAATPLAKSVVRIISTHRF